MLIFLSDFGVKHGDWSMHIDSGRFADIERFIDYVIFTYSLGGIKIHRLFHFNFHFYLFFNFVL
jgi:hypothetical protein